jgi:predicted O-methyltransferase YrrM
MLKSLARTVLPTAAWSQLQRFKQYAQGPARFREAMGWAGFTVARKSDYYSPLPSTDNLRRTMSRWNKPSALRGINYDLGQMKIDLTSLLSRYLEEFLELPPYAELQQLGFGPGYTAVDGLTLYLMIRHLKPARYLEVGSGLSTYYCSRAAAKNREEGDPVELVCVEPHVFLKLRSIPDIEIIEKEVQDLPPSAFQSLQSGDVLFIDSSHAVRIDSDVPFLYLEVLPSLAAGVVIHVHDVPFPFNFPYPPEKWIFGERWPKFWNEAMMVQAFLSGNQQFRVMLSTPLLRYFDEPFLKRSIPIYETLEQNPNAFSSLWLRKVD